MQRYHFADKGPCSQNYGFSSSPVLMWELDHKESWAPKNLYFPIVVLEKTLESPVDYKEIKSVNPKEYSLERVMLKLKLQYFGLLMQRADSLEKTLMLGKTEGKRRKGQQRMRWLDNITDSMTINSSKLWEMVETEELGVLRPLRFQCWTWLRDQTTATKQAHCSALSFFLTGQDTLSIP